MKIKRMVESSERPSITVEELTGIAFSVSGESNVAVIFNKLFKLLDTMGVGVIGEVKDGEAEPPMVGGAEGCRNARALHPRAGEETEGDNRKEPRGGPDGTGGTMIDTSRILLRGLVLSTHGKCEERRLCSRCAGDGRVIVGERRVTREMAIDAGCPQMEGIHAEFEYAPCHICGGDGTLPLRPKLGKQARAMLKAMGEKYIRADFQYRQARGETYWGYFRERRDGIAEAIRAAVKAALEEEE